MSDNSRATPDRAAKKGHEYTATWPWVSEEHEAAIVTLARATGTPEALAREWLVMLELYGYTIVPIEWAREASANANE